MSVQSLPHKERFIKVMNYLRQSRDEEIQTIMLLTKHRSHFLTWKNYDNFLESDSESIGSDLTGYVNVNDIVTIGYAPKNPIASDIKYHYIDLE